jgi:heat shock protein HslJ
MRALSPACPVLLAVLTGLLGCQEPTDSPSLTTKTLYIAPYRAPCTGVGLRSCLLVREQPDGDWTYFYSPIEGFDFEEGYRYTLRVEERPVENPPADASSLRWQLVEVLDRTEASPQERVQGTWQLAAFGDADAESPPDDVSVHLTLAADSSFSGLAGCNDYFGRYEAGPEQALSLAQAGLTRKLCPPPVMAVEQRYLDALGAATTFTRKETQLQLHDAAGRSLLTFTARLPGG